MNPVHTFRAIQYAAVALNPLVRVARLRKMMPHHDFSDSSVPRSSRMEVGGFTHVHRVYFFG